MIKRSYYNNKFNEGKREYRKNFYKVSFYGEEHKDRFYKKLRDFNTDIDNISNDLISVIFLLSYNNFLWRKVNNHIHFSNVDFENFDLSGINTNEYLIFKASQSIYGLSDEAGVTLYDLADRNLCSGRIARTICDAVMIKRYGFEVI